MLEAAINKDPVRDGNKETSLWKGINWIEDTVAKTQFSEINSTQSRPRDSEWLLVKIKLRKWCEGKNS